MHTVRNRPWFTPGARKFLERIVRPEWIVLEFGSGGSTFWLSSRVNTLITLEHDPEWADAVKAKIADIPHNTRIVLHDRPYDHCAAYFPDEHFDLVIIDGRDRVKCTLAVLSKVKKGGYLIFDNAQYPKYQEVLDHIVIGERWNVPGRFSKGKNWRTDVYRRPRRR